jgi:hypothetical protein
MNKLFGLINALKAGESLANLEAWKRAHIVAPYLVPIITFLSDSVCNGCIKAPDISTISLGIATLGAAIVNHYFVSATTTKIGVI